MIVPHSRIGTNENGFWTLTDEPLAERPSVREARCRPVTSFVELGGRALRRVLLERLAGVKGLWSTIAQRAVSLATWFASIQ